MISMHAKIQMNAILLSFKILVWSRDGRKTDDRWTDGKHHVGLVISCL